ncbi:VfN-28 family protein [Salix suchowensis]|nr:VfN-28 family protein [Salix suchowensis]
MEVSSGIPKSCSSSGAGAGEVRRVHIIYFLSHNLGCIEHPHLIRVLHFHRNGVYLRDVKRWLADLRGKDMPKAFAWSYKRRYKKGYVWQDLIDDDLITPISDNEYVLKGSRILLPPANPFAGSAYGEKRENTGVENKAQNHELRPSLNRICRDTTSRNKSSPEISKESPSFSSEISSVTDDSIKDEEDDSCKSHNSLDQEQLIDNKVKHSSFYTSFLGRSKKNQEKRKDSTSSIEKSRSYSNGTSKALRNLIRCGAVDTNDAALVLQSQKSRNKYMPIDKPAGHICEGEELGGSARVFGTPWNQEQQQRQHNIANARKSFDGVKASKKQHNGFGSPKVVYPAYKPLAVPTCSQCGKSFRPERLHSHMKSCRGFKVLTKAASTYAEKSPSPSHNSADSASDDGYFLTN